MCGLVGYFTACDLKLVCPLHALKNRTREYKYRTGFDNWDRRAAVRAVPSRVPEARDLRFPEEFVPIAAHERIRSGSPDLVDMILSKSLYRFLNFTHKLELLVVNTVTLNIAVNRYNIDIPRDIRLDAHRIYTDEAYHALFSFEMMIKMNTALPDYKFIENTPPFIALFQNLVANYDNREKALLELMFVVTSEMLITGTLHEAGNLLNLDDGVRNMLRDHARDEARHHGFYSQFLAYIWETLQPQDRIMCLIAIPQFVRIYCEPDHAGIRTDLREFGCSDKEANDIYHSVYTDDVIRAHAYNCGSNLFRILMDRCSPNENEVFEASIAKFCLPANIP